jgi:hypothetical protein
MPIEIRELVIKATVTQNGGSSQPPTAASSSGNNNISAREEIINTCVEKIIGILKDKYER